MAASSLQPLGRGRGPEFFFNPPYVYSLFLKGPELKVQPNWKMHFELGIPFQSPSIPGQGEQK